MSEILNKALDYARHGWPVFPVAPRGKKPLTEHGFYDASTDETVIRDWWFRWPTANVGLPTGATTGFWVLDVDGAEGARTLAAILERNGTITTPISRTGSGGLHYLFRHDPRLRNTARFMPGLDTRADGGYIVAPPSIHQTGDEYHWEQGGDLAVAPDWLLDLIINPAVRSSPISEDRAGGVAAGQRNAYLASFAGRLRRIGLTDAPLTAALMAENTQTCQPPLNRKEVEAIANSILRYAPATQQATPAAVEAPELVVYTASEFVAHDWPIRNDILSPWLKESSLIMLHAERGLGKSLIAMTIGMATSGCFDTRGFGWQLKDPCATLYVDAEMVPFDLSERIVKLCEPEFLNDNFRILSAGAINAPLPSLTTPEGRLILEDCIKDSKFVILDNVSTLWSGTADENAAESWSTAQEWLLSLRRKGIAVMVIDHAGKTPGRGPRGTSRKEDAMDICIELTRPSDYMNDDGARFIFRFTKNRFAPLGRPVECWLRPSRPHFHWEIAHPDDLLQQEVYEALDAGKSVRTIERELGVPKSRVQRMKAIRDSNPGGGT